MNQENPITKSGLIKVEKELEHLIKVERESLKVVIAEARELGDLKENAEYHAAKEKQSHVEGRIAHLQAVVASSRVVEVGKVKSDKIVFGATVTLYDTNKDESVKYQIVGEEESDSKLRKISYKSPLGKAMIGKEVGDTVLVKAPKGDLEFEVEDLEYIDNN
ncbi:MAG: transcription elongation factor GreA [Halobacteriovorax sp.]|nr:transcription elongation factor GreA [Halobacteriovorax sp.]